MAKVNKYNPSKTESVWQEKWAKKNIFSGVDYLDKKKFYLLIEFPYPSGAGLHVGHVRSWTAMDVMARLKRMKGMNVLFPIGWDGFGLPAENYAIKTGIHPSVTVPQNIVNFRRQIKSLGLSFDWEREVDTTDPNYYKWTQWIFLKLYERGLAYQAEAPVNWCPKCKTNLADEEVLADGTHERCGEKTEKRLQKQWILAITKYADRLIDDLKLVNFAPEVSAQQVNWIGRSEGVEINFRVVDQSETIKVFTTRPDTLYGATFVVISPDSPWVDKLTTQNEKRKVEEYLKEVRTSNKENQKDKTGVFSGSYCVNPATQEKIPVWISDYVVGGYGSGAIMAVAAHDQRDWEFATKYKLPIREVIVGKDKSKEAYVGEGKIVNSAGWNGLEYPKDIKKIVSDIEKKKWGKGITGYHLHDWIFSRQHYWGEPIPIVRCPKCGAVPVREVDLPVTLPYLEKYEPSQTGESPLANVTEWVETTCPKCGGKAKRETDTMPNWAGSNWYFIRYTDPNNESELASSKKKQYWLPVDLYQGGYEHTTLHLLYSRFIYKFLYDIGVVPGSEPYLARVPHGIVLASDGRKMSKSFGNVISPDEIVGKYGADALRLYIMFMGPFNQTIGWSDEGVEGCSRFLGRLYRLFLDKVGKESSPKLTIKLHQTIKKVGMDIEAFKFNTVVSSLMEFTNTWNDLGILGKNEAKLLVRALAPIIPHLAEELWVNVLGEDFSVHCQDWPDFSAEILKKEDLTIIIQVDGKVRGEISVSYTEAENEEGVKALAQRQESVVKWLKGGVKKTIFVPKRLINFVTHP